MPSDPSAPVERLGPGDDELGSVKLEKLHPTSLFFGVLSALYRIVLPGLFVLLFAGERKWEALAMIAFVPVVVFAVLHYLHFRYRLLDEKLEVREGVIFKKTRFIPYHRIQNVDAVQTPLHRMLGVAEARLETASGHAPEAVFKVISVGALDEIRRGIFERRSEAGVVPDDLAQLDPELELGTEPVGEAAPPPLFAMSFADVLLFGFLSQRGIAYLAGALYIGWEFDVFERIGASLQIEWSELERPPLAWLAAGGLGLLLILQVLTVVWAVLTLFQFRIVRRGDDLRTTCGLWTHQSATVPRHRIQFLAIHEGPVSRLLRRIRIKIVTAGGDAMEEGRISRKWLVPLGARDEEARIVEEVNPRIRFEPDAWRPVHARARGRMLRRWLLIGLLPLGATFLNFGWWGFGFVGLWVGLAAWFSGRRARRLGWQVSADAVYKRDGILGWSRQVVPMDKVQTVAVSQSPFDRRAGMARLEVATAGPANSGLLFSIPYLPLDTAHELRAQLQRGAARESFSW